MIARYYDHMGYPGDICSDCGHFAVRHLDGPCAFERPNGERCTCPGFLWAGERYVDPRDAP